MTAGFSPYPSHARPGPPWPPGQPGQQPWPGYQPRPSKALAGWALGLSLVPGLITMILAVVFAFMVLGRSKDGRDHGKGMAVAALCIVPVWIAVLVAVIAISVVVAPADNDAAAGEDRDQWAADTPQADGDMVRWAELKPGDCFKEPRVGETFYFLTKLPCRRNSPQVYAVYELDGPETHPGNSAMERRTDSGCLRRYERYLERRPKARQHPYAYFYPVADAWNRVGERTAICYVVRSGGEGPPTDQQPA